MDQAAVIIIITTAATTTAKRVIHIFKLTTHANEQKETHCLLVLLEQFSQSTSNMGRMSFNYSTLNEKQRKKIIIKSVGKKSK